jgi:uncharacterized protein
MPHATFRIGNATRAPVVLLLCAGLAAAHLATAGCASDAAGPRVPRVRLITGSAGSDWDRIGSAIASQTNRAFSGQPVTAVPGAGGISNPARLGRMSGDFALGFLPFLHLARDGAPPYREAFPGLVHVASLITNTFQVVAAPALGLTSLGDIRERRLAVRIGTGPPGSGEEFLLRETLTAYGMSYEDIRHWGGRIDLLGSGERADLFRDYHLDVIVFNANAPSAAVTELMLRRPGRLIPLSDEVRDALRRRWHVRSIVLPADTYASQPDEVPTVGMTAAIFTTRDMPDLLVDALVAATAREKAYLETVHPGFRAWQPEAMADSDGLPQHPAAARLYEAQGWTTP